MANDDKHKVPHLVGSIPTGVGFARPDEKVDLFASVKVGPFEGDDIVGEAAILRGAPPETDPEWAGAFDVAFSKDSPALGPLVMAEVDRLGREVDKVLSRFRRFF